MECPKCGGGCLLSEEELVKILDERAERSVRAVIRGTYICRACTDKFTRLFMEDLSKRKKPEESRGQYIYQSPPQQPPAAQQKEEPADPAEGLKFF